MRAYGFLACVLPYNNPAWEKRSIFLNFLIPKLPSPPEEDPTPAGYSRSSLRR